MRTELELWQFVTTRLEQDQKVMLLVVGESSGSSPGRKGYKMAVAEDGSLNGSIGGGIMEVNLVEHCRTVLRTGNADSETRETGLSLQVHRENDPHGSGMLCSGKQTVIVRSLDPENLNAVRRASRSMIDNSKEILQISPESFTVRPPGRRGTRTDVITFEKLRDNSFLYTEILGQKYDLLIIGGGHCALALSELMAKMDFHISIFDDRPGLNTIQMNHFAHVITIVESYDAIDSIVAPGENTYVVVMTLGYRSDETVIRKLFEKPCKYFGVLGSRAKMARLMKALTDDGIPANKLDHIRTPIGIPINSRTPEEIAVSIAAEIISVKNAD